MLRTPLCDELGIEHPVMSAGMGRVALAELAAAVSEAGGLGVLGAIGLTPAQLRDQVRRVRALTDKPFGVDLLVPRGMPAGAGEIDVPAPPGFLAELLRETANLPPAPTRPPLTQDYSRAQLAVCVEEKVPLLACALGTPQWAVELAHAGGMKVLGLVGSVRQALAVEASGADFIVAQGGEAGGHTGEVSTFVLVPAVVDAVSVPVIAAGGIADGRGLAAALMFGAQGVWMGTRFLATAEASTPRGVREEIVRLGVDGTTRTRAYTGKPARAIRNRYTRVWEGNERFLQPMPVQQQMVAPIVDRAQTAGRVDISGSFAGQSAGLVHDVRPAADVVAALVDEAERAIAPYTP